MPTPSIALGSPVLAADGKTLTGTLSGGSGSGYAITNANGLQVHTNIGYEEYIIPTATPVIVGTGITIALPACFLSGQTVKLNVTAASTLTDSGSNTAVVATNTAVTNNSAVTGSQTYLFSTPQSFNFNGQPQRLSQGLTELGGSMDSVNAANNVGFSCEWVVNVTAGTVDLDVEGYYSSANTFYWQIDGGALQSAVGNNVQYSLYRVASALGVGKHVVRHNMPGNFYTLSVRVTGSGTASIVTVPCPVVNFADANVKTWGTLKTGTSVNNVHPGFQFNVVVNGTGLDMLALATATGTISYLAIDAGTVPAPSYPSALFYPANVALNGAIRMQNLAAGLSPGSPHTVEMLDLTTFTFTCLRAHNGSKLASSASIADATISVPDTTYIAAGDWLCLDQLQNEEVIKVASISGSGPYTLTLASNLAKAHATGVALRNFTPSSAPTFSAGTRPAFDGRLVVLGDSITHAAAITTAAVTPAPGYSQYDIQASHAFMAARAANFELIHGATQGWTSANVAVDNASNNENKPADVYSLLIGTNDFGAANTPLATYETNIETIIGQAKTAAPAGAKILVHKIFSNTATTTNAGGHTKADFNAQQVTAVAAQQASGFVVKQTDIARSLNKTPASADIPDSTHPSISGLTIAGTGGQNKMGNELVAHLKTAVISGGASGGPAGIASAPFTYTLPANAVFIGLDTVTLTATDGAVTATTSGGSVSGNGGSAPTITPPAGATAFTFTYSAGSAGAKTVTITNGPGWTNPSAIAFTASNPVVITTTETLERGAAGQMLHLAMTGGTIAGYADFTLAGGTVTGGTLTDSTHIVLTVTAPTSTGAAALTHTPTGAFVNVTVSDTTAPSVPGSFAATATAVNAHVSWSDVPPAGDGPYTYDIQRSADAGVTWTTLASAQSATTYDDNGLSPATAYQYRVRAHDAAGNVSAYTAGLPFSGGGGSSGIFASPIFT